MSGRRRLFRAAGAVVAAIALPAAAAPADTAGDAELLDWCARLRIADDDLQRHDAIGGAMPSDAPDADVEAHDAAILEPLGRWDDAIDRITKLPATTPAGLVAKARAVRCAMILAHTAFGGDLANAGEYEDRIAVSLADDILRGMPA